MNDRLLARPATPATERPAPSTVPLNDEALTFACEADTLVGVLTRPVKGTARTGLLLLVGGPQYRAGSHRHFVEFARDLARSGWPVFRFDVRGMGDSTGEQRTFEQQGPDVAAAIVAFRGAMPDVQRIVLWGLCDGASSALLYLDERPDPAIAGVALVNPWVRSADSYAAAQVKGYYAGRLFDPASWRALARGRIGPASLLDFGCTVLRLLRARLQPRPPPPLDFVGRMARGWARLEAPSLVLLSANDLTAREFVERVKTDAALGKAASRPAVRTVHLADADHTLSSGKARDAHRAAMLQWLHSLEAESLVVGGQS